MKNYLRLASLLLIFSMNACTEDTSNALPTNPCFQNDAIAELPWLKNVVSDFQKPKSGSLEVILYVYKNQYFIGLLNPSVSSPASYIYNCNGDSISKLNIGYNQFMAEARTIEVLLKGNYWKNLLRTLKSNHTILTSHFLMYLRLLEQSRYLSSKKLVLISRWVLITG